MFNAMQMIGSGISSAPAVPPAPRHDHTQQLLDRPQRPGAFDARQYLNALHSGDRTGFDTGIAAYRTQMQGYHTAMQNYRQGIAPAPGQPPQQGQPQTNPALPPQPLPPQAAPWQAPVNNLIAPPANMVGQRYGVGGMNQAASPYGMPTY